MTAHRFDELSKMIANRRHSRRTVLRQSAMGSAALAALGIGKGSRAAQDATPEAGPGEEWVQLYESMAAAAATIDADCATVVQEMNDWLTDNSDQIEQMQQDIETWTKDQRAAHQAAYSERVQDAAISLHLSLTRCGYKPDSTSPLTHADITSVYGEPNPPATPMAMTSGMHSLASTQHVARGVNALQPAFPCDTACEPGVWFTVGNCILWSASCLGGDAQDCCWAGICVAGYDFDQCVSTCNTCVLLQ